VEVRKFEVLEAADLFLAGCEDLEFPEKLLFALKYFGHVLYK
jgi:hypothetical protein